MTLPAIEAVRWTPDGALRIIDQRYLPEALIERDLRTVEETAEAIRTLAVRGAPAIGVAAAMGLAAAMRPFAAEPGAVLWPRISAGAELLRATRPTAVNLGWALDRMLRVADASPEDIVSALHREATAILEEDRAMCRAIGEHGAPLLRDGARVLTHCNAGALATAGIGTALAPVYVAHEQGKRIAVIADETRPLLQGARLTAWELHRAGVPVTVATDGMAAALMRAGEVEIVLVGADRIAANGDVANKIGTYGLAVLARHHGIPFYVVAPSSTFDAATPDGTGIPIEQRDPAEITHLGSRLLVPVGVPVHNPAFDVTPAALITGYITERGVVETLGDPHAAFTLAPPA